MAEQSESSRRIGVRGNGVEGQIVKSLVGYCQDSWLLLCVRLGIRGRFSAEE